MKLLIAIIIANMLCTFTAFAGDKVICEIKSDQPIIIDGNWIYPENSQYTVAMTDSSITVNGYVYLYPEDENLQKYEPPSKENDFFDWVVRAPADSAQHVIESGGCIEEARQVMVEIYNQYAGGDTFSYVMREGDFILTYHEKKIFIVIPSKPRAVEIMDYRDRVVVKLYEELCNFLESGNLILRGTNIKLYFSSDDHYSIRGPRSSYIYAFPPSKAQLVIREIQVIPEYAEAFYRGGVTFYKPITILNEYWLKSTVIEDIVSPKPLSVQ